MQYSTALLLQRSLSVFYTFGGDCLSWLGCYGGSNMWAVKTEALMSGKFRFKALEDLFSGKLPFLVFEWISSYHVYTHRDGGGGRKVSVVSSFKGTHKDSTLLTKLSLADLPLNTSP